MTSSNFQNLALRKDTRERLNTYATKHNLKLSEAVDRAISDSEFFRELYKLEVTPVLKESKDG